MLNNFKTINKHDKEFGKFLLKPDWIWIESYKNEAEFYWPFQIKTIRSSPFQPAKPQRAHQRTLLFEQISVAVGQGFKYSNPSWYLIPRPTDRDKQITWRKRSVLQALLLRIIFIEKTVKTARRVFVSKKAG